MYEFKRFSGGIIKLLPVVLIASVAFNFFGVWGRALSVTMLVLAAQILIIAIIGVLIRYSERSNNMPDASGTLTFSEDTRRDIVEQFSKKYDISLNSKMIGLIVEASYSSQAWEDEIKIMSRDYNKINELYRGKTGWLHIYLKAFKSIQITSDFEMQKRIVLDAFKQIIGEPFFRQYDIKQCIRLVNRKYLAQFDEISFMDLCSYMRRQGYDVVIPDNANVKVDTQLDTLVKKYDNKPADRKPTNVKPANAKPTNVKSTNAKPEKYKLANSEQTQIIITNATEGQENDEQIIVIGISEEEVPEPPKSSWEMLLDEMVKESQAKNKGR